MDPLQVSDERSFRLMCRLGGITPLIGLGLIATQILVIALGGEPFPSAVESWFALLQKNRLLGLIYLNCLDILTLSLLGPMFIALFAAHKGAHGHLAAVALFLAVLGIAVFVAVRAPAASVLSLVDRYAVAATAAERSVLVTAAHAVLLATPVPQTAGFFFVSLSALIFSLLMVRSDVFPKAIAVTGIIAAVLVFVDDAAIVIAPSVAGPLMAPAGAVWLVWWVAVSVKLLLLGRTGKRTAI